MTRLILTALLLLSSINAHAANGCTPAQVMKTIHSYESYLAYAYGSDWNGEQKKPTMRQHANNDQYLFWVERDGTTYPAIVTYQSGKCTAGVAVVKENQGE